MLVGSAMAHFRPRGPTCRTTIIVKWRAPSTRRATSCRWPSTTRCRRRRPSARKPRPHQPHQPTSAPSTWRAMALLRLQQSVRRSSPPSVHLHPTLRKTKPSPHPVVNNLTLARPHRPLRARQIATRKLYCASTLASELPHLNLIRTPILILTRLLTPRHSSSSSSNYKPSDSDGESPAHAPCPAL